MHLVSFLLDCANNFIFMYSSLYKKRIADYYNTLIFIISLASLKYYLFGLHEALGLNRQWF